MLELIAGLDAARVATEQGFGNTARLLAAVLDLSAGQARARVHDAEQPASRRTLTGEVLRLACRPPSRRWQLARSAPGSWP